jgi:hypothetical protein
MAIAKRFKISHDEVFPHGAYLVSAVTPVVDFERSTRDNKIQQTDQESGLPLWTVDVLDADPDASRSARTVAVKIAAKVQPVPPSNNTGSPFTPVVFSGLSALPYVERVTEEFSRVAWSFRAESMTAPGKSTTAGNESGKAA